MERASGSKSEFVEAEATASGTNNTLIEINGGLEVAEGKIYKPEDGAIEIIQVKP